MRDAQNWGQIRRRAGGSSRWPFSGAKEMKNQDGEDKQVTMMTPINPCFADGGRRSEGRRRRGRQRLEGGRAEVVSLVWSNNTRDGCFAGVSFSCVCFPFLSLSLRACVRAYVCVSKLGPSRFPTFFFCSDAFGRRGWKGKSWVAQRKGCCFKLLQTVEPLDACWRGRRANTFVRSTRRAADSSPMGDREEGIDAGFPNSTAKKKKKEELQEEEVVGKKSDEEPENQRKKKKEQPDK